MTRKADTLRPFLRCAAVVLCSLALPLVLCIGGGMGVALCVERA